jgi:hypothetical protein
LRYGALVLASAAGIVERKAFTRASAKAANSLVYYRDGASIATFEQRDGHDEAGTRSMRGRLIRREFGRRVNARGSFYSIGQALTPTEVGALHNAVRNLQSALNRAIN